MKLFPTSPKELLRRCNLGKTQRKKAACDFDGQLPKESPNSRTAKRAVRFVDLLPLQGNLK